MTAGVRGARRPLKEIATIVAVSRPSAGSCTELGRECGRVARDGHGPPEHTRCGACRGGPEGLRRMARLRAAHHEVRRAEAALVGPGWTIPVTPRSSRRWRDRAPGARRGRARRLAQGFGFAVAALTWLGRSTPCRTAGDDRQFPGAESGVPQRQLRQRLRARPAGHSGRRRTHHRHRRLLRVPRGSAFRSTNHQ